LKQQEGTNKTIFLLTHGPLDSKPWTMITFRLEISIIHTGVVLRILRLLIHHTPNRLR